jgi:predicted ATPase/DNA-binding winged helix-turn-helix (wHTH) protein
MLTQRSIYEFDDFRVDTGQFLLCRMGLTSPLTPTVFRILVLLLEHAGQVVTKEELVKHIWPDSFVEEGNLNRNVSTLRKALGEKPSDHRYIETVPKLGYRFSAPVRTLPFRASCSGVRRPAVASVDRIVGRDKERQELRSAFDLARDGHGSVVGIAGDVGLGKTALVDAFLQDLAQDGQPFQLARSRCSESLIEHEPFMPWIEGLSGLDPSLKQVMKTTAPSWHREVSHTGAGVPRKMKRELLDFCKEASSSHPLVIVIDDFQWSDHGSVDLLAFLAARLESTSTMVIVCYRMEEMKIRNHPFVQIRTDLLSRGACKEIRLLLLQRQHMNQYLALQQPNRTFTAEDVAFLHARTEGNPLFLREMLRHRDTPSETVENIIRVKLERLDDTHRQLLVTASLQGREFDSAVLASSMHMSSQDVEEALKELWEIHGLIQPIREEQLPDGKFTVRYRFVYAFCQEACYASLAPTRKASLNATLGEAFLTYYGN